MALRGVTPRRRHVLPVARAFFTSNPPFPLPPPPPPANDPDAAHSPSSPGAPRNPASSLSQGIRDRLRSFPASPSPHRIPTNLPRPNPARGAPSSERPVEDIRQMLQNFRNTGGAPSTSAPGAFPSPSAPGSTPSFMDVFRRRSAVAHGPNAGQGVPDLDSNRGSLKGPQPRTPFRTPSSNKIFRREPERNWKAVVAGQEENGSAIALKRSYSYEELGKRLGELRPAGAGKDGKEWFSLTELQGRIAKLAELEKPEKQPNAGFPELRRSFENLQNFGM